MAYEPKTYEQFPAYTGPELCRGCDIAGSKVRRLTESLRSLRRFDDRSENIPKSDRTCFISLGTLAELEANRDEDFLTTRAAYFQAVADVQGLYEDCPEGSTSLASRTGRVEFCGNTNIEVGS